MRRHDLTSPHAAIATLACLAVITLGLLLPAHALAETTATVDVVVVGDSVTNAMGVTSPLIDAWPVRLSRLGGLTVLNRSVGGDTTEKMVARFDSDVVSLSPKAVVILGGLNDLRRSVPAATIHRNIEWMVARAQAFGIKPYLGTVTPLISPWQPIQTTNQWMRDYAARTPGVGLIDFYRALEFPPGSGTTPFIVPGDWCHPSANGQWLMTLPALSEVARDGHSLPTNLTATSKSNTALAPGAAYVVAGTLQSDRVGLPGQHVVLQSARPGTAFQDVIAASSTSPSITAAQGGFTATVRPTGDTRYRLRFPGSALYAPSKPTVAVQVGPRFSLGTPVAPALARPSRSFSVYGFMNPRHPAGSYPVEIHMYRYVAGHWKSYGHVDAKASDYPGGTKYSRRISLSYRGRWRIRAYAPLDREHFARWSSGYDYVTVR